VSCVGDSTKPQGGFAVYGRIVYRPLLTESSLAEFFIFNGNQPVTDAIVTVGPDTVSLVDADGGAYRLGINVYIGDSLAYNIVSGVGRLSGTVTIPDTVSIFQPHPGDTISIESDFTATWRRGALVDGYYVHLENQEGLVADINVSQFDTTSLLPGDYLLNIGPDRFWVETLNGAYVDEVAPNGEILPRGVVGAAGNYKDVYIDFAP
jgi:hypothetical protein